MRDTKDATNGATREAIGAVFMNTARGRTIGLAIWYATDWATKRVIKNVMTEIIVFGMDDATDIALINTVEELSKGL